jgi:hypothetical protein
MMSLLASIDAWISDYLKSQEAALARLQGASRPPSEARKQQTASIQQNIETVGRHRAAFLSSAGWSRSG